MNLKDLSKEELQELIQEKEKEEREAKVKARREYERKRDELVTELVEQAKLANSEMRKFKTKAMHLISEFQDTANAYGDIKKHSKGGFSLRTREGDKKLVYDRNTKHEYDERAAKAEVLLKEFLEDKVKKRDLPTYRVISALLKKNNEGDFKPSQIAALLDIKDNYDDERWRSAMDLLQESYQLVGVSNSVSFYEKDGNGKDKLISLSFPSLSISLPQ